MRQSATARRQPAATDLAGATEELRRHAKCMRKHGVPNFADPVFGPGGEGIGYNVPPGAFANDAAGILLASRACAHVGSPLPLRDLT